MRMSGEHLRIVTSHALSEAPRECCGLLLGIGDEVHHVFRGRNTHDGLRTYGLDPSDQLRAFRMLDREGWDLIGVYHSHPDAEAYPSDADVEESTYPDARCVIVSLVGDTPSVRAFRISCQDVTEEDVIVT